MKTRLKPELRIFPGLEALSEALAAAVAEVGRDSVAQRGVFRLVLNGGGTPEKLFSLLGQEPNDSMRFWEKTQVFWGDERCVPPDQGGSNYKQASDAFLSKLPLDSENVHRIPGEYPPEEAAAATNQLLAAIAEAGREGPRFDLVLLGMGRDGHTASLFPGTDYGAVQSAAVAVTAEYAGRPADRVTLTPRILNGARRIFFMAAGEEKAVTLADVLEGPYDPVRLPAQWIRPPEGQVTWWLDEAIAAKLDDKGGRA